MHLTREAARPGADAFLAVTPYYNKPPAEGIYRHFAAIAEAAGDRPGDRSTTSRSASCSTWSRRCSRGSREIDNVVAVKQATTDLDQARAIVDDGRLALYAGNDDLLLPFGEIGGIGGICVASHLAGERDAGAAASRRRAATSSAPARIEAELAPLYEALVGHHEPDPGQGRAGAAAASRSAGRACRSSPATDAERARDPRERSSAGACSPRA